MESSGKADTWKTFFGRAGVFLHAFATQRGRAALQGRVEALLVGALALVQNLPDPFTMDRPRSVEEQGLSARRWCKIPPDVRTHVLHYRGVS